MSTATATTAAHGPERIACRQCGAGEGISCTTISRKPCDTHRKRWKAYREALRSREFIVTTLTTDDRLGVTAGEEYVAEVYWLDPGKVTLLRRTGDGYDPECNQYWGDLQWERWA